MDLIEQIDRWSIDTPERLAHVSADSALRYGELTHRSNVLASSLSRQLPDDQSPIAVCGHKEPEMLVAFLGVVKSGHPYIPLDSTLPEKRVETILRTANASMLLTPQKIRELIARSHSSNFTIRHPSVDDPWYIIFTSGSTGDPKGVIITAGCLESFTSWVLGEQEFREREETFLNQAPFSFDLSVMDLYSSLLTAGTLFSLTKDMIADLRRLFPALAHSDVSVWVSTPSFAQLCLTEPTFNEEKLPHVRKFWFCGETLTPETAGGLLKRFPHAEVWNTYGPTEATVATTSIRIDQEVITRFSPLPVGRPKPDTQIKIIKDGAEAGLGDRGEIVIAGPNVSPGYVNRPDLTSLAFFKLKDQRAYHTGDLGHVQDGLLFFDGRIDFQIKLHGYRIEIGDIENNLHALPLIQDAVIVPVMKHEMADYLAAFVILKERPTGSDFEITRTLKRALAERLPEYMIPRKFIFLKQFPMTANGKADRRKLAGQLK